MNNTTRLSFINTDFCKSAVYSIFLIVFIARAIIAYLMGSLEEMMVLFTAWS